MKYLNLFPLARATILCLAPADDQGGGSFFKPDGGDGDGQQKQGDGQQKQGDGQQKQGDGQQKQGDGQQKQGDGQQQQQRPDWLLPKYNTPEDQAKAYSELYGQYSKKTEDLRKEVLADAVKEYGKSVGVPEKLEDYAYPEGFSAPAENVDKAFREWAQKNNVGKDAFQDLVKNVYGQTVANAEVELKKLGEGAVDRIKDVNAWVSKNVPKDHFGTVSKIMTTAEGVAFMEGIMSEFADSGFAPDGDGNEGKVLSRDEIRKMQEDPKWGVDEEYTKKVRAHWAAYAALPPEKRK